MLNDDWIVVRGKNIYLPMAFFIFSFLASFLLILRIFLILLLGLLLILDDLWLITDRLARLLRPLHDLKHVLVCEHMRNTARHWRKFATLAPDVG